MNTIPKQAMVLAAGLGKRMRPLTDTIPKPMIEVAGRSIIDRAIDNLMQSGVEKIVVNTSYKAELLETHLAKRESPAILFSREEEPLETGGGIAKALLHFGNDPFFCVNGDVIWLDKEESALSRLAHRLSDEEEAVLLLHPTQQVIAYAGEGDFFLNAAGHITRKKKGQSAPYIYTGIQILRPSLFTHAPAGAFSLNILYDHFLEGTLPRIKGIAHTGEILHVGDPASHAQATHYLTLAGF